MVEDFYAGTRADDFVKFGDILGLHADTPVTRGGADGSLFGGAVDVDEAFKRILVAGFETVQPEDTGHDRVASGGIRRQNFAGWNPRF